MTHLRGPSPSGAGPLPFLRQIRGGFPRWHPGLVGLTGHLLLAPPGEVRTEAQERGAVRAAWNTGAQRGNAAKGLVAPRGRLRIGVQEGASERIEAAAGRPVGAVGCELRERRGAESSLRAFARRLVLTW